MMKAVQCVKLAEPNELETALIYKEDVVIPEPKKGEVRIKVVASALNPVDWKQVKLGLGINDKFPHILGLDVAGIIHKIGEDTECRVKVGDRVVFHGSTMEKHGGFAEYSITVVESLIAVPKEMKLVDAASMPTAGYTAFQMLYQKLKIHEGQSLVISGASGAVGQFGIQLAKNVGCTVIGICSGRKADEVKSLGADFIIDYTKEDVQKRVMELTNGEGVDRWMDCVGPASCIMGLACLSYQGELATIAGGPDEIDEMQMLFGAKTIHWVFICGCYFATFPKKYIEDIVKIGNEMHKLFLGGKLKTFVTEEVPLEKVCDALKRNAEGKIRGKIMCRVSPEV
eukprot:TRINITY_DN40197_c0_g1_i1.p1 TRINITY_DN40197_c0_g1~~TRINITY_DN40197_c0_g1_i1.p1  ORF type:complete len:341 (+),score=94.67 TRINITY_DN40197_c0_g1_i1:98-1120(+)